MSRPSFLPYRELAAPVPPEGRAGFDPAAARRRWLRPGEPRPGGRYVLYWLQMYRRTSSNAALAEAARRARALGLPLVVYEGLNHDYPGASLRIHRFVLESARDTARALHRAGVPYVFRLRRGSGDRRPGAAAMIREAALAVVDDFPAFILPGVTRKALEATEGSGVPVLAVDDNGVVPPGELEGREYAARTIRPKLHRLLPAYLHPLDAGPVSAGESGGGGEEPGPLPELPVPGIEDALRGWDEARIGELLSGCDIDHRVPPSPRFPGGREAALRRLHRFIRERLPEYPERQRDPAAVPASGLSPYLHFGCLSAREVALAVLGAREAPGEAVDAFLEQLVVRRELAFNFCRHTPVEEHASLDALPEWARKTLAEHADDEREHLYGREELEAARTHDEVWNAAQRELLATGTIQNYLRMLWGKQIIRWTPSHEEALRTMVELHDRYALDGRDPNSYANILWCFGLHDRAFQETPVLGKARPMTTASTRRKFDLEPYFAWVARWEAGGTGVEG